MALSVSTSTTARREDTTHSGSYVALRSSVTAVRATGSPPRVTVNLTRRENARVYDQRCESLLLSRGRPARHRRRTARPPRPRPLPLAREPGRPAHEGMVAAAGRADRRLPGGPA